MQHLKASVVLIFTLLCYEGWQFNCFGVKCLKLALLERLFPIHWLIGVTFRTIKIEDFFSFVWNLQTKYAPAACVERNVSAAMRLQDKCDCKVYPRLQTEWAGRLICGLILPPLAARLVCSWCCPSTPSMDSSVSCSCAPRSGSQWASTSLCFSTTLGGDCGSLAFLLSMSLCVWVCAFVSQLNPKLKMKCDPNARGCINTRTSIGYRYRLHWPLQR